MNEKPCWKCAADAMERGYLSVERDVLTCADCGARSIDWKPRQRRFTRLRALLGRS